MEIDIKSTKERTIIDFQKSGYIDLCVLGRYKYNKAEKKLEEHVHEGMIEICYYEKGSQLFVVNNKKYLVKGGDIFIHFPGEIHSSGGAPEGKGSMYWLIIKTTYNNPKTGDLTCANVSSLLRELIDLNIRHFHAGNEAKKILEAIFQNEASKENKTIKNIRTELLLQTFLLQLFDIVVKRKEKIVDQRLHSVLDYISTNLTEDISITMLAKETNLSESRFKNWFKTNTGFTPADYIQRQRVFKAIEIIQEQPDISLATLAYSLNFSTTQYFSTVMKKYTGKTPTQIKAKGTSS
ncbi:AraC family transcriptional regulator [Flavobacterium gilvum]|uniref:HTH araC/xylS-type domain-containing protein n=1 Tax=Flavobacterium gilvum TaxID=1492737 RepID=A0AAC9I8B1_9FLAO|nr:AraC family transcriptional regulator [Flavobacterium gilvum]AOW11178.1 hypothetical protein EM308_17755 [Flavobacterium gilvum]KFC58714.1 hypothetical protein FEM08_25140 [Flavobacterium gilvum]